MHLHAVSARAVAWLTGAWLAAVWLAGGGLLGGCGETLQACAVSSECPVNTACVAGVCQKSPFADGVTQQEGETSGGDGGGLDVTGCGAKQGGPSARSWASGGVVDGQVIAIGGETGTSGRCPKNHSDATDAWLHERCVGWSKIADPLAPSARLGAASATDVQSALLYVFGGRSRTSVKDGWQLRADMHMYDRATKQWRLLSPAGVKGTAFAGLAVDRERSRLFVVGGDLATQDGDHLPSGLVTIFDLKTRKWALSTALGAPPPRSRHAMTIAKDRMFVLGGLLSNGQVDPRMWMLELNTNKWSQYALAGTVPTARVGATLLAVDKISTVVLFGGEDGTPTVGRNDVWTMDPLKLTWKRVFDGDVGPDGVYNSFPALPAEIACQVGGPGGALKATWLNIAHTNPPRRAFATAGYDRNRTGIVVFGGRGDCGPLADLWVLSTVSWTWQALDATPTGWSCPRRKYAERRAGTAECEWLCSL